MDEYDHYNGPCDINTYLAQFDLFKNRNGSLTLPLKYIGNFFKFVFSLLNFNYLRL